MLAFTGRSYTPADVQAKYGAPYDTGISQWYSVFTYRLDSPSYTSKVVFEIDPVDGAVLKVAISLKLKKRFAGPSTLPPLSPSALPEAPRRSCPEP
jgi:hypothetical protein